MSCSHSKKPGPCSQCIPDAPIKRVTLTDTTVLVDGQPQPERPRLRFGGK